MGEATIEAVAGRLATLLTSGGGVVGGTGHAGLVPEQVVALRPLPAALAAADVWAVDGGQATVADGRCLAVVAVRAARARWQDGTCTSEGEEPLRAYLLGGGEARTALADLAEAGLSLGPDTPVDANLLRDAGEWALLARTVEEAEPGGLLLVDGDLQPDWRIPGAWAGEILGRATARGLVVAGVTKHSGLSRGGAPLVGQLELEAESDPRLGPRARWWAAVAHTADGVAPELRVSVARLDPSARFAFRVDLPARLPGGVGVKEALGMVAAVSDDAAFPGYPYPLSVADRLAACPPWVRDDARLALDEHLERVGVGPEQRDRCFSDRHRLMERA
ncbi:MAG: DNA double-strand break repair nuclease NurA [Acidimicrobiales bacterium]